MSNELPELEIGVEYVITHNRKGTFTGIIKEVGGDWAAVEITTGTTQTLLQCNQRTTGEETTVRRSFCKFKKVENS